jgi:dTDP-4-amino-4,6-dideoxygalactose transaminase
MIQLGNPLIGEAEIEAISELLADGHLSIGDVVASFEADFAELVERTGGAAVASGSVALELALGVMEFEPGDGIVLSPYNCGAILYSPLREDLVPVFADIDPATCNLDPDAVRTAISAAEVPVEGLLLTHLYGLPTDYEPLAEIAEEFDLTVVNDFSQAPGATYHGKQVGSLGDIGVCSFGATKNITTAEGGIVVSDDTASLETVRTLRSNTGDGTAEPQRSVRMNDLEAAIDIEQIDKYDEIRTRKRRVASIYRAGLPDEIVLQPELSDRTDVYHGFPIRSTAREALADKLTNDGIATATVYDTPLYEYEACPHAVDPMSFPNTERVAAEVLLLPIHANVTEKQAEMIVDSITEF